MLSYNEITRDPSKLPEASLKALLARGYAHYLGNEQSSKVVSRIRSHIAGEAGKAEDVTKEQVKAFRTENAEQVQTWTNEIMAEALKALDEGTMGVRAAGGVRLDPVAAAMHSIARVEVAGILKTHGLNTPTGKNKVALGGEEFTMAELIERRLDKHGERVRKEAERKVADEARKRAKIEAEAKQATGKDSAEALGL